MCVTYSYALHSMESHHNSPAKCWKPLRYIVVHDERCVNVIVVCLVSEEDENADLDIRPH